jgi:hypothetical protein
MMGDNRSILPHAVFIYLWLLFPIRSLAVFWKQADMPKILSFALGHLVAPYPI